MLDARTLSRRSFMRRMVGAGVGILSLEFVGGSLAFLWPKITDGLGASSEVGKLADIIAAEPDLGEGRPVRASTRPLLPDQRPRRELDGAGEVVDCPSRRRPR